MKTTIYSKAAALITLFLIPAAFAGGKHASGIPNPAAVNCIDLGGKLENSLCVFDRAMIEEWTLWRATAGKHSTSATEMFLQHPGITSAPNGSGLAMPNPASVYCEKIGGKLEIQKNEKGNQFGMCTFQDNSSIEEWTLFAGPTARGNAKLAGILQKYRQ